MQDNQKIIINQNNYQGGTSAGSDGETLPKAFLRYKWLVVAIATVLSIGISQARSLMKETKVSPCESLRRQLQQQQTEINVIQYQLSQPGGADNDTLVADSKAHAIMIAELSYQLNKQECNE